MSEQEMASLVGEFSALGLDGVVAAGLAAGVAWMVMAIRKWKHNRKRADAEANEIQQDIRKVTEKRNG